jgi:hypothetical protein
VTVRSGAGVAGSHRITLIWSNDAIEKQWLEITVKADAVTGLAAPDVFYFGNAVGESGNSTTNTFVDGSDFAGARDNPRNFLNRAPVDYRWDYNRDSFVDGSDLAIARDHNTNFLTALKLIDLSPSQPSGTAGTNAQQGEGEATSFIYWTQPFQIASRSAGQSLSSEDATCPAVERATVPSERRPSVWHQQSGDLQDPPYGPRQIDAADRVLTDPDATDDHPLGEAFESLLDEIAREIDDRWNER